MQLDPHVPIRTDPEAKHGRNLYNSKAHLRCRCRVCKDGNAMYQAEQRAKRRARLEADPTQAPHGEASTYANWGCRCDLCLEAFMDDIKQRRA